MIVFENIITNEEQLEIKNLFFSDSFPWYFQQDISYKDNPNQKRPGLSHVFYHNEVKNSEYESVFKNIISNGLQKMQGENFIQTSQTETVIINARAFLQLPLNEKLLTKEYDSPHIDIDNIPHTVFLYYVCDSDGDTLLFDNNRDRNIIKRITPKQGTLVVFDGSIWHTAEQPLSNLRSIINIDIRR